MKAVSKFLLLAVIFAVPANLSGQFKVDFKKKVVNQTNSRANHAADKAISEGLDAVENGVKDAVTGDDSKTQDQNNSNSSSGNSKTETTSGQGNTDQVKSQADEQPSLQAYTKYDFLPGEKIIFFEDFSQDAVGDFPALWNTNGSAEVVTTNLFPGKWMKFDCRESIWTDALLSLPDNYTIEFDIIPTKSSEGAMSGYNFRLMQSINARSFDYGARPGRLSTGESSL
jgi:OOP family OmpA-OmpF porin